MEDLYYSLFLVYGWYMLTAIVLTIERKLKTNWNGLILILYVMPVLAMLTEYLIIIKG